MSTQKINVIRTPRGVELVNDKLMNTLLLGTGFCIGCAMGCSNLGIGVQEALVMEEITRHKPVFVDSYRTDLSDYDYCGDDYE